MIMVFGLDSDHPASILDWPAMDSSEELPESHGATEPPQLELVHAAWLQV